MLQKFLSAGFVIIFSGTVNSFEKETNVVSRDSKFSAEQICKHLSLCMAILIPTSALAALLQKFHQSFQRSETFHEGVARRGKIEEGLFPFVQYIPWREVYASGEFNVCLGMD